MNHLTASDLSLPRLLRHRKDETLVCFDQPMSLPFSVCFSDAMHRNLSGLEVAPNSANEIQKMIEETIDRLHGTIRYSTEDCALQHRFMNMTADKETLPRLPNVALQCKFGRGFLYRYQNLLT